MNREKCIINATTCLHYLAVYEPSSYTTLEIGRYEAWLHYLNLNETEDETERLKDKLGYIVLAGAELKVTPNSQIDRSSIDIVWDWNNN